ncbi:MAG TPA: M1 family aminopeptidase, partial [Adhaeribacter sp.]|nr:M1 family aminopeptidase [Adhaeribacter sp.]
GEFYSEFGSFDVKISLPENYTLGATGQLQTASELARLDSLAAIGNTTTVFGKDMTIPVSSARIKTLHYVQDSIHDFAWFADKRFNVRKGEVELPFSKRKVTTWQMFLNRNAPGWVQHTNDLNEAILAYSAFVGEYPYTQATAVDGALGQHVGGMEYPMVTVTSPAAIIHEVGHNWFYGILGSNERDHAWLDEGLNSYVENRMGEAKDPDYGQMGSMMNPGIRKRFGMENLNASALNAVMYQVTASRGLDQPIQYPSEDYFPMNYGGIVYQKTAVVFKYLAAYLGQERFDTAMKAYYEKWKFKHPYPEDLQATFEQNTGENLDWFFKDMILTTNPVDVEIKREDAGPAGRVVTIKNESDFPVPVPVAAFDNLGNKLEEHWTKPFTGITSVSFNTTQAARYVIDPDYLLPELNRRDNQLKTSGLFKKCESLHFQKLAGIEQHDKTQFYWLPVIGANTADKFMLGAAFYNSSLIAKKFNYLVMPMYSISRNEVNGIANFNFNLVPHTSNLIRQTQLGFNFQRFEYFYKYEPSVTVHFKRSNGTAARQSLKLGVTYIYQENEKLFIKNAEQSVGFSVMHSPEDIVVPHATYNFQKGNHLHNFDFTARFLYYQVPDLVTNGYPTLKAEAKYERYWSKDKKVEIRGFGGKFLKSGQYPFFYMGMSGNPDYLRESIFLDRAQKSESYRALIDQTDGGDGGFKNYIPAFTDKWLATLNLVADLPALPLSAYLDLGKAGGRVELFYGTGLMFSTGKGFFSLYFPLAGTNFTNNTPADFKDFSRNIRFSLRLNMLNPFKLLNEKI